MPPPFRLLLHITQDFSHDTIEECWTIGSWHEASFDIIIQDLIGGMKKRIGHRIGSVQRVHTPVEICQF
jgi:hypothetical protein